MSHIDSFKHELVGMFGSIWVYRLLEDEPDPPEGWPQGDFGPTSRQLIIGGGSGEHPSLVLLDAAGAVANFVLSSGDFELTNTLEQELSGLIDVCAQLHFAEWTVEDYHRFYGTCTNDALPNPFDPESDGLGLEDWLHCGLGEFIYYAMPNLAADLIIRMKPLHKNAVHMRYNNVMVIPPQMPVYANGGNAFFKDD